MFYYLRKGHMLLDNESSYMRQSLHDHNKIGNVHRSTTRPHNLELKNSPRDSVSKLLMRITV